MYCLQNYFLNGVTSTKMNFTNTETNILNTFLFEEHQVKHSQVNS